MSLNRLTAPELQAIEHIEFIEPKVYDVTPTCKLICMPEVQNETARLDLFFDAGTIRGKRTFSGIANEMALAGTNEKSSTVIHEDINNLGGFMETGVAQEHAVITVYALRDKLLNIARIIQDAMQNASFPEHELEEIIKDKKQSLKIEREKVSILAQRAFRERLFSSSELYSYVAQEEDYDQVNRLELMRFFKEYYLKGLTKIVVVGGFTTGEIDAFIDLFGSWAIDSDPTYEDNFKNLRGKAHIEKNGALQTAVRLGRTLFTKTHEDYKDFLVLNTILGDYFGSRLMTNIREDKGYTYGIGTLVGELQNDGYFAIVTEVGKDVTDATLVEIKHEIDRLRTETVGEEELQLVKNYMLGQLLKSADGPYALVDLYLGVEHYNMDLEFYNALLQSIKNITPERILELAQKYLVWDEMTIVTAG